MPTYVWLIIMAAAVGAALILTKVLGNRNKKKMDEQQAEIDASKQTVSMLVIDKKKLRVKQAGLPDVVGEQIPWYFRWRKLPIVKAKVGPRIMSFMTEDKIYNLIPVKKEIKATIAGLYIVDVRGLRTPLESKTKKKKGKKETKLDLLLKKGRGEI